MSSKDINKKKLIHEDKKKLNSVSKFNQNSIVKNSKKRVTLAEKETDLVPINGTVGLNFSKSTMIKKDSLKKTQPKFDIASVLIMSEEKKPVIVEKDNYKKLIEYKNDIRDVLVDAETPTVYPDILNEGKKTKEFDDNTIVENFLDADGFFITAYPDTSDSDESDGGESGYEADIEDNPETPITDEIEEVEPPVLLYNYDLIIKKKKRFLYNNLAVVTTNFLLINYVNYLFYKKDWLFIYPESIRFKLAARKYRFRLNKYRNDIYYSKKLKFDISGSRAVLQLTSRYRNKFFTFLRKSLHFNLSVGRVFFWKLKKTVYGRVINFYNVFFRCVIPFMSRRFTIVLYKLFRDWSNDFQKFNGAVLRARRSRKIRRTFSIFKVIIFPKLIYGFMRSAKYPIRKRFLQRKAFIKYMCS